MKRTTCWQAQFKPEPPRWVRAKRIERIGLILTILAAVVFLAACAQPAGQQREDTEGPAANLTPVPLSIDCTIAYRPSVTVPIEGTASVRLSKDETNVEQTFSDFSFHAVYGDGTPYEGRFLAIWITPSDSDEEIHRVLFQLWRSEKPVNQMQEHGFTGLNYIYHPVTRAELQYWCVAE